MPNLPAINTVLAALAKCTTAPESLNRSERDTLFTVIRASYDDALEEEYENLADQYLAGTNADDLQQDAVIAISRLPSSFADDLVPDLISFFKGDEQFYELGHALVSLTFPVAEKDSAIVNSTTKRRVLAALLANDTIWNSDQTFRDCLARHGLPETRKQIEALLAHQ